MDDKIVLIPVDKNKFNDEKIDKATVFLNEFFYNDYKCSFVYDNQDLCLRILKKC
nr:unnamed protein product [uncultured bacterium]